jgi:N-acetylglucosaminyl-diphospho-decaprenol L-rhamnosyltransferase
VSGKSTERAATDRRVVDVAVVVVSHNSSRHLAKLGEQLAAGTTVPARKVVVDNASRDGSPKVAAAAGFEVIETGRNDGFGAGCNAGLRAVENEFVLFCNPDIEPAPEAIEQLLSTLRKVPDAAIAGGDFDEERPGRRFARISGHIVGFLPGTINRRPALARLERRFEIDRSAPYATVDYAVGAFILCRTAPVREIGGFDESFFLYFEEVDLALRLSRRGWKSLLVPSARVAHEHGASSEGVDAPTMTSFRMHSAYLYYRKHFPRPYAELARLVLAAGVLGDRAYRTLRGRPQVYGRGAATAPFRSLADVRRAHALGAGPR